MILSLLRFDLLFEPRRSCFGAGRETIRRYVFDLKQAELIALKGRGGEASIQLAAPTIVALTDTIRQWVKTFRAVDRRISKIREFG